MKKMNAELKLNFCTLTCDLPTSVVSFLTTDIFFIIFYPIKIQFYDIYLHYSILYADIVGFTAISSTYSASDLVKILNELFARFDRLSEVMNDQTIACKTVFVCFTLFFFFVVFRNTNN